MDLKKYLVLYVEDEWSNRLVFEHSFNQIFRVKTVARPDEALAILKEEQVAVLLTDQRMPEMSGNDLLVRVKELYPTTIRVVVTAYSELDPILRAVNEGLVARYIVKPWDRAELEELLRWGVEAFALGQENTAVQLRLLQTERLVTLGSLGSAIIHDLNQPLAYLINNVERLSQLTNSSNALKELLLKHGDELSEQDEQNLNDLAAELGEIVHDMDFGCGLMNGIVSGMRRLLHTHRVDEVAEADPIPIIRYALQICHTIAIGAQGNLFYDGPTDLPRVRAGSTELTQVMINLVANAAQSLERRLPGGRVVVGCGVTPDKVNIVVKDDGPGMSAEILQRVGTPFFTTRKSGTGLGLAQCRRLVEREKGEFKIESTEGAGTTVTVTLLRAT